VNLVVFLPVRRRPARQLADALIAPDGCGLYRQLGGRAAYSCAACRPMRSPTGRPRPPHVAAAARLSGAFAAVRASRRLETHGPVLNIHFRKGEAELSVFTTIATLGTPQDVTLQESASSVSFPPTRSAALSAAGPKYGSG